MFRFDPARSYRWRMYDEITVATVAFNRLDCTQKLIESILRHIHLPFRWLVVDNGERGWHGRVPAGPRGARAGTRHDRNRSNVGLPRALLQIRRALGDGLLIYFDNDVEILFELCRGPLLKAFQALKYRARSR